MSGHFVKVISKRCEVLINRLVALRISKYLLVRNLDGKDETEAKAKTRTRTRCGVARCAVCAWLTSPSERRPRSLPFCEATAQTSAISHSHLAGNHYADQSQRSPQRHLALAHSTHLATVSLAARGRLSCEKHRGMGEEQRTLDWGVYEYKGTTILLLQILGIPSIQILCIVSTFTGFRKLINAVSSTIQFKRYISFMDTLL